MGEWLGSMMLRFVNFKNAHQKEVYEDWEIGARLPAQHCGSARPAPAHT